MPEVSKVRTPATVEETRDRFTTVWIDRFRSPPSEETMNLLLALWDLETGTGKSQFNHNHGNQISTRPDVEEYYLANDSGNIRKFRSYPSVDAGAKSFVSQITSDTRPEWHRGLLTGDPTEFVRSLKGLNGGPSYFEASLDHYLGVYLGRWNRYAPKAPPTANQALQGPTGPSCLPSGLLPTGCIDWSLVPALHPWGKPKALVQVAQALLNAQGYHLVVDGIFGPVTANAVRAYQIKSNLSPTNLVDSQTWESLVNQLVN